MELEIGERCDHPSCRQNDFLPFACNLCHKTFCMEHRTVWAHACPHAHQVQRRPVECPVCSVVVTVHAKSEEEANLAVEEHFQSGECGKRVSVARCHHAGGCKQQGSGHVIECLTCHKTFCVSHRHHECTTASAPATPAARGPLGGRLLGSLLSKFTGRSSSSSSSTSTSTSSSSAPAPAPSAHGYRLDFANTKASPNLAAPNAAPEDKYILAVIIPANTSAPALYVQFSRLWTVGRALDAIARVGKIKNENNKPNGQRLQVFDARTGAPLATSAKLDQSGLGKSAGVVVLEYNVESLSPDVVSSLAATVASTRCAAPLSASTQSHTCRESAAATLSSSSSSSSSAAASTSRSITVK